LWRCLNKGGEEEMKKIGIVGGMGPESTLYYYRMLIDLSREEKGLERPVIIIYSVQPRGTVQSIPQEENKAGVTDRVISAVQSLYQAGADFGIIACNTAHRNFSDTRAKSPMPLLSIVEETCKEVGRQGLKRVGLIGSLITMSSSFYQDVFSERNISIVVPAGDEQIFIDEKVFGELVQGIMLDDTRNEFLEITRRMIAEESIEGLILGCTEIPLLLNKSNEEEFGIPFFDTSRIHVQSAFRYCLS